MEARLTKKLEYGDTISALALWWKSLFLMPIWGVLVVPAIGFFALLFINGNTLDFGHSPGWQICLAMTMFASIIYFVHDLRKRTIYFNHDLIKFGLRKYALEGLISIGVEYKSQQMMPRKVVLRFRDGKMLRLKVSRLQYNQFESVLHFVETRLPQVHIDPVILTMMRCRRTAGKAISDSGDSVEIRYESRFALKELSDVFARTWDEWSVFGPVLVAICFTPMWLMFISSLFMWPLVVRRIYESATNINFVKALMELWEKSFNTVGKVIEANQSHLVNAVGNPIVVLLVTMAAALIMWGLLRMVLRPNRIIVQADSIRLIFRLASYVVYAKDIHIDTISKITLAKPTDVADPSQWLLRFSLSNNKTIDLSIAALSSDEKARLMRAIQRLAPQIPIDAALLETMTPRQDRSYTELWLQSLSSAPERKSLDPLEPGQMLANQRYQIIRCLGVGGQGTAYLSKDTALVESHLSEMVVLKESIFPVYADSAVRLQALERFEKEASLLRRLEHPGIVALRDYFMEDHRGYLVMEHADGKTLKQLVEEEGPMGEIRVRELALQMCDILSYLHANGVVHRDFTPDNLILNKSGQLKVIDFNVAQQIEAGSAGTIVGKQSYLPPEQFRGKATTQSDIYALGASLFFLLTGEDPEPITQSSPLKYGAACSASLDQMIRDCTALQTQKRIATSEGLKECLIGKKMSDDIQSGAVKIMLSQQSELLEQEQT